LRHLAVSFVFRLASLVSPGAWKVMSRPLGYLTWLASGRKRRNSLANLAACYPEISNTRREQLARASMRHFVRNVLETGIFWYWPRSRLRSLLDEPRGLEHLNDAMAHENGTIVLLPHFGAWEMYNLVLGQGEGSTILYKPGADPQIEKKMLEKRARFGVTLAAANSTGLKLIYRTLQSTSLVGILPDQEPSLGQGRFAPFFGVPALTGVLVHRLIRKTDCRVIFTVCARNDRGRFRVHYLPAEEEIYSPDPDIALAAVNRGVEQCIAIDPPQYLWAYKRFRTRPEGEKPFY